MDSRIIKLSNMLTSYSCDLQKGDRILIDYEGETAKGLVCQLIKDAYKLGAKPFVNHRDSRVKFCLAVTRSKSNFSMIISSIK